MTLAEIRRLQLEAQTQLESALAEVLRKQELDLITHGRAEPTPTESPA